MTASTTLLYGQTRTAKTSQARFVAERVWKKYKKKTRFITSDTGSMWAPIQDLVDVGIVKPIFMPEDPSYNPQSVLRKLRRGEWPKGDVIKASVREGNGWKTLNEWLSWEKQEDSKEIGAYVFESMTTFGEAIMRDLREKNITVGQKDVPGLRREDGEVFASNTESHYGNAQMELSDLFLAVAHLPVHEVLLTAHEVIKFIGQNDTNASGKVALQGAVILGPNIPGKMAISSVPAKVGACVHMQWVSEGNKRELRAYIQPHASELPKYLWPAGLRSISIPSILDMIDKRYPGGYMVVSKDRGIGELFDLRDEILELAKEYTAKLISVE